MPGYGPAQVNTWSELCFLLLPLWTTLFLMALTTICTIKNNDKHFCMTFYNNCPTSCASIGGNLHLIRVQTIKITWWHNLLFSFSRVKQLAKNFQQKWRSKLLMLLWKTNQDKCSMVCTLIDHRNDAKMVILEFWKLWCHFYGWL